MKDLENVIPNPLNKNMTINKHYSYDYINSYVNSVNENSESKISAYYYATSDFSGLESTNYLSKKYNCQAIRNIPKQTYKLNSNLYIPSIGELSMAMEKVQLINNVLKEINKKQIDLDKIFASSTFYDQYNVWDFDMNYAKISYSDIINKRSILPFFRYEPLKNQNIDYAADTISNNYKNINLFSTLEGKSFNDYVFSNYYKVLDTGTWHSDPYPIYENNHVFVGMPYKNIDKKDKLRFYIVIPTEPIIGGLNENTVNNYLQSNDFDGLTNYVKNDINVNPFFKNLLITRKNYFKEIYIDGAFNGILQFNLNINYLKCIIYTFENYLDIFELKYREIFELSNNELLNCAEYLDSSKKKIKFEFDRLGYFDKDYCIAIGIELRYYKVSDGNYNILYRNYFFYNNYDILLSFPYTNKTGIKYLEYHSQENLSQDNSTNNLSTEYVNVNNYNTNNNDFKYFLSNYPKFTNQNNILINHNENRIAFQFKFNKIIYGYSSNSITKYNQLYNFNNNITYYIRHYKASGKIGGVFGGIVDNTAGHDVQFTDISTTSGTQSININVNEIDKHSCEMANAISFNTNGIQHDIIFDEEAYKKIIIRNQTNEHVNIWIEDETKRLCTNKVRLCIPPNKKFVTYASIFLESYYIKFNIELHNKYKFGNDKSYYNINININNDDAYSNTNINIYNI